MSDLGFYTSINERLDPEFDPVDALWRGQLDDYARSIAAGDIWGWRRRSQFSLGAPIDRRDIPVGQGGSVPGVGQPSTIATTPALSGPTTRVNQTPHQSILPGETPEILPSQTPTGGSGMALDLGNILADIAGTYIQTRWGTPQPVMTGGGVATTPVAQYPAGVGTGQVPLPVAGGGPLAIAGRGIYGFLQGSSKWKIAAYLGSLTGLALTADEIAQMATDLSKVKCKRRRRRLATHSDIKDLAALSAVLGKGKLLETWVATRRI